jgi:hypothetical protein
MSPTNTITARAQWIGDRQRPTSGEPPCPYLRRSFQLPGPVRRATLTWTALGVADMHLNGAKIGGDFLMPRWSDFRALLLGILLLGGTTICRAADRMTDLTGKWEVNHKPLIGGVYNLYDPCVVYEPGQLYPYKMWLFGWAAEEHNISTVGGDAIYHARSRDMLHWEVYAGDNRWDTTGDPKTYVPVLSRGQEKWNRWAAGDPSVVKKDDTYFMAYSSVGVETVEEADGKKSLHMINCVMGAKSPDGIHWSITKSPILLWKQEDTNRWTFNSSDISKLPDDYYGSYLRPSLMWDNGRWKIWFDYYHPGTFLSLGYAENGKDFMDPAAWEVQRADKQPLLKDYPNPCVIKVGEKYYAFSDAPNYPEPLGGDGRLITMAESGNGVDWSYSGYIRPEGMASSHVPQALLLKEDGVEWLYVFYAWKPQTVKEKPLDFRYKEIRAMRIRVGDL